MKKDLEKTVYTFIESLERLREIWFDECHKNNYDKSVSELKCATYTTLCNNPQMDKLKELVKYKNEATK